MLYEFKFALSDLLFKNGAIDCAKCLNFFVT